MNTMSDEEFIALYGRPPVRKRTIKRKKIYWNRIIIALIILIALIAGIVQLIGAIVDKIRGNGEESVALSAKATSSQTESSKADESTAKLVTENTEANQFVVCIDAGHGDYDGGTTNQDETRIEKNDNLDIALEVQKNLEAQGVTVIMTRDDDSFLELEERCELANEQCADLFVSLHRNSYDGDIYGIEVWVSNDEPEPDTILAENILAALEEVGISDNRGVEYGYIGNSSINYLVNAQTVMPSCLVEMGFITSPTDNALFDLHLEAYGEAIAEGIIKTAKDLEIINEDGSRKLEGSFISEEKYINRTDESGAESSQPYATETTPASTNSEIIYNTQENEYAQ
ncbi:MAG: N-acetylmuramoyl-L-alanine amidase [Hominimerdicola sp.]